MLKICCFHSGSVSMTAALPAPQAENSPQIYLHERDRRGGAFNVQQQSTGAGRDGDRGHC